MRARAAVALAVSLALPLAACSVIFGLEGYAGSGKEDGGDASPDGLRSDRVPDVAAEKQPDALTDASSDHVGPPDVVLGDCATLPPPTAYWKIDEGSGSTITDSTGHGNTGTFVGGSPDWVPDVLDGQAALSFNGTSNEYVDFLDPADLQFTGSMTISVWFNLAVVLDGGPDEPILSKRSLGDRGWQLYVSDEDIVFDVAHNMAMYQPPLYGHGPSLQAGLWYHSVAIYKAGSSPSLSVYVNGDWVGTQYADGGAPITQYNSGNNVHLGASAGCTLEGGCPNVQLFNGLIAQVEVFGTDLSPCQVEALP